MPPNFDGNMQEKWGNLAGNYAFGNTGKYSPVEGVLNVLIPCLESEPNQWWLEITLRVILIASMYGIFTYI